MPKQWYHISHMPPAPRTSSPYFPPLWTPIFGWLLCEPLLISGHPKAMEYFIYIFFHRLNSHPERWGGVPPHALPPTRLHPNISPTTSANYCLIVGYCFRSVATLGQHLPISLFFDASLFSAPNRQTSHCAAKPHYGRLARDHREPQHHWLETPLLYPWR